MRREQRIGWRTPCAAVSSCGAENDDPVAREFDAKLRPGQRVEHTLEAFRDRRGLTLQKLTFAAERRRFDLAQHVVRIQGPEDMVVDNTVELPAVPEIPVVGTRHAGADLVFEDGVEVVQSPGNRGFGIGSGSREVRDREADDGANEKEPADAARAHDACTRRVHGGDYARPRDFCLAVS